MHAPNYAYKNITAAGQYNIATTAGVLHAIVVNTTAAGTIAFADGNATAGTVALMGTLKASVVENDYTYDTAFGSGLRVTTTAGSDITVVFTTGM